MAMANFLKCYLFFFLSFTHGQISFNPVPDEGRAIGDSSSPFESSASIIFEDKSAVKDPQCAAGDGSTGFCITLAQCSASFLRIPSLLEKPCETKDGLQGVCCPQIVSKASGQTGVLKTPPPPRVPLPDIKESQLLETADASLNNLQQRFQTINSFQNPGVPRESPAGVHQNLLSTSSSNLKVGNDAQLGIEISKTLVSNFKLTKEQGTFALPKFSARKTIAGRGCPPESKCRPGFPYRTYDGSCNNEKNPDWGKAGMAMQRILPPAYGDGVNSPRVGFRGQELPSARHISANFSPEEDRPDRNYTLMLMQWGQFLDHDLTHTPIVRGTNGTSISCCQNGQMLGQNSRHPDCFPIEIPTNDRFFAQFNQRCMEFLRALPAPRRECNFGPREQMNQITAFIDGSNVYGSDDSRARSLREGAGGRLLVQKVLGKELMPGNPTECSDSTRQRACFKAGDLRVNEQLELAVLQTIWLREHNRIARELQSRNPRWSDNTLFEETRRIVVAEMQHINYNEFLPIVLGVEYMTSFQMFPLNSGFSNLYNDEVDPTTTNVFAAAAFRFGHTLVQGIIKGFNKFGAVVNEVPLSKTSFAPFSIYDSIDSFVRGLVTQESQKFDNFMADALTKHLFQGTNRFGLDLMSLNIQRGRDQGLPPYLKWRDICGLPKVNSWEDLRIVMEPQVIRTLQNLYQNVQDIDLFVGGIAEIPLNGAILGPTFVCLVGDQFARLRRGDRFFYEEKSARFTEGQLDQIRKVSLARILCDNSDDISVIQSFVLQSASFGNKRRSCTSNEIPSIDFNFWREATRSSNPNQPPGNRPRPIKPPRPGGNLNQFNNQRG